MKVIGRSPTSSTYSLSSSERRGLPIRTISGALRTLASLYTYPAARRVTINWRKKFGISNDMNGNKSMPAIETLSNGDLKLNRKKNSDKQADLSSYFK